MFPKEICRAMFPPGLLREIKWTLALFYPPDEKQSDPRLDIEMGMFDNLPNLYDPSSYHYWQERLCAVHEAY